MLEEIKTQIHNAARHKHKMAMFHYQVLIHAHELADMDMNAVDFCKAVCVPESYATEFRKMLSLDRLMEIKAIKKRGGSKSIEVVGGQLKGKSDNNYLYAFLVDTDVYLRDDSPIRIVIGKE
ncbi:hypothetical protein KA005_73175 [bacterium]|nr:hypothetical protein [bacterium]